MSTYISGDLGRGRALYLLTMQDACTRALAEAWPYPRWCKFWSDDEPMPLMTWVNKSYCEWYEIDGYRYVGHCDRLVWPDDVAAVFLQNDQAAIDRAGEICTFREPTPRNGHTDHRVRKFAVRVDNNEQSLHGWAVYGECSPD